MLAGIPLGLEGDTHGYDTSLFVALLQAGDGVGDEEEVRNLAASPVQKPM